MHELALSPQVLSAPLAEAAQAARGFANAARALNTRKAYASRWRAFEHWCRRTGARAFPVEPEILALYVSDLAREGYRVATIDQTLAAISEAHRLADLPSPRSAAVVAEVMKGIRRTLGVAPTTKAPLLPDDLRAICRALPPGLRGVRDRALLLLGFAGGFRRVELVQLVVEDLAFLDEGVAVELRRSKTDPEGQGRRIGIPYGADPLTCPVRALEAWLERAALVEGPLFRPVVGALVPPRALGAREVAATVRRALRSLARDPAAYGGHSLRAGLVTAAAVAGKTLDSIMTQTGHRSVATVRRYIRRASVFQDNAAAGIL